MDTIRLIEPGAFELIDTEEPEPPLKGIALVKVLHVGLCGTDIHAFQGNQPFFSYPRILGHELGVEIVALGEGCGDLKVGVRCSVEPYLSHSGDRAFARGKTNCSSSTQCMGVHVDGGMRERILIPAEKLHPSNLDTDQLALVETLCIGHHAVERAALQGDETIAVIGMGPIGLGVSTFANLSGAEVVCIDISQGRLDKAQQLIPGVRTLLLENGKLLNESWSMIEEEAPEVVFDCTGNKGSMEASVELPGFGGRIVFVGIYNGSLSFSDPSFHKRELSIVSSRNARAWNFKEVIGLMESGKLEIDPWITHRCALREFPDQVDDWLQPDSGLLKGVIEF
ncbi:MAG: zinc-binding alcohol dehydrogenase family protein [Opitutales bacterium]